MQANQPRSLLGHASAHRAKHVAMHAYSATKARVVTDSESLAIRLEKRRMFGFLSLSFVRVAQRLAEAVNHWKCRHTNPNVVENHQPWCEVRAMCAS